MVKESLSERIEEVSLGKRDQLLSIGKLSICGLPTIIDQYLMDDLKYVSNALSEEVRIQSRNSLLNSDKIPKKENGALPDFYVVGKGYIPNSNTCDPTLYPVDFFNKA